LLHFDIFGVYGTIDAILRFISMCLKSLRILGVDAFLKFFEIGMNLLGGATDLFWTCFALEGGIARVFLPHITQVN
jgi:hypothetical protein